MQSRVYGLAQTVLFVAFAAVVLFNRTVPLFFPLRGLGLALCALGILVMAAAFVSLREVVQVAPQPREGGHLVTSGIYRFLRHPIYTGILIVIIGLWLRKPTPSLAVATAVVIVFLLFKTRFEEQLLAERYPEYVAYRSRSFGLIPPFRT